MHYPSDDMVDSKILVVAVIAVVAVVAAGAAAATGVFDKGGDDGEIVIIDGAGKKIVLDEPLTSVVLGNVNVPKMCNIIGANDAVKGLSFYSDRSDASNWEKYGKLFPKAKHMAIEPSMTAEQVKTVANAVIVPVSSMTLTYAQELSYNQMGIKVIRLDCNGETAQDDMEKLTKLFGANEEIMKNYNEYWSMFEDVKGAVLSKVKAASLPDSRFLYYYGSFAAFYNQTSASSDLVEEVSGKNALREIPGLDLSTISNKADVDGIREAVLELDYNAPIDRLLIRGSTTTTSESAAVSMFKTSEIYKNYRSLNAITNDQIYAFASDPMSGCLAFIGYILVAEAMGVDTELDPSALIAKYNERYGFSELTTGLMFAISVQDNDVSAIQLF